MKTGEGSLMRTVHLILIAAIFLAILAISLRDTAQEMYAAARMEKMQ
jgi:hypothetical protein